jgi:cardiolipin synthase A/B
VTQSIDSSLDKVQLVHGGKEYFILLKQLIANAKDSIYLQTYIFGEDQTGTEVANELKAAALRQVKVFVLVDGYASGSLSDSFIKDLKDSGVHFRMFDPLLKSKYFYLGRRLHHKVVVVDEKYSLVGGINISDRYNDMHDQPAWLDWAVYAEGEVATHLSYICKQRVKSPSLKKLVSAKRDFVLQGKDNLASVKINDWVRGKREITNSYLAMFRHAKKDIIIMSAYFLPNGLFRKALKRAAKRGVKVQLILAGRSDVLVSKYAERYLYRWLLKNGIGIYEYQKSVLHGKMAAYDGLWATVGSYNVNSISAYASIELNLAINDCAFAQQAENSLNKIMNNDCVKITEEQINHSGFIQHAMQRGAYYVFRILFFLFTFYFKQRE